MRTISIRELHLDTGRWVRTAAEQGPIIVTDRGRQIAALQPIAAVHTGARLPDRRALIAKMRFIPVDSGEDVSWDRDR